MADKLQTDLHFAIVPRWVVRHPNLTSNAVRVYAVLADHADKSGRAFPSRRTIGVAGGGMSVPTVARALVLLLDHGALSSEQRSGGVTMYTIHRLPVSLARRGHITDESGTRITGDTQKKTHSEVEPLRKTPAFPKEQTEQMFAVLVEIFGTPTKPMSGAYGRTVNDALDAGIKPEEVGPAARRYRERWPGAACTPMALVKHWNTFGPDAHLLGVPVELRDAYRGV